ncbi:bifunctional 4-hydroxy-2-oxoglutarate aldolase/2-dehydro-3-deoxy-phosphogluconate aldolase [uncultured Kriegella sp.]|uniref:bifunctional 4-hydroxy-2-oxoglutarate aldolase/2-dehydro-3-deoxy-phosphogluconate aldolase n=1 Tax=uncultured Kriegella sp. TaxID=1798910 RepID=UPI0030DD1F37|tara:strand:+ start:160348 stop:160974 length:627 start_codon:yes stop_codon:yes gene_type:complete
MKRNEITAIIEQEKIVAIVRLQKQDEVKNVLKGLVLGGVKVLEITSNTPGFLEEISKGRELYGEALIGAGTVTNTKIAADAIKAGAQFLVTPNTNSAVIKLAHENDIPVLMGALTPTEVCVAVENGADIVKLFPAGTMGFDYFKAIRGPLSNTKFFVVGGIDLANARDWMAAGASGLGIGSVLTKSGTATEDVEAIRHTAQQFVERIK